MLNNVIHFVYNNTVNNSLEAKFDRLEQLVSRLVGELGELVSSHKQNEDK